MLKTCSNPNCRHTGPLEDFPTDPNTPTGRHCYCRKCKKERDHQRNLKRSAERRMLRAIIPRTENEVPIVDGELLPGAYRLVYRLPNGRTIEKMFPRRG